VRSPLSLSLSAPLRFIKKAIYYNSIRIFEVNHDRNPTPDLTTASLSQADTEQLEQHYTLREPQEVLHFLNKHSFLIPLLLEAPDKIHHYFPDAPLYLAIAIDPESSLPDSDELVILIETDIDADESVDRFLEFDRAWWGNVEPRSQGKMFIDLE